MKEKIHVFFGNVKTEFRKIIWPGRDTLKNEFLVVLLAGFFISVCIAGFDFLMQLFVNALSSLSLENTIPLLRTIISVLLIAVCIVLIIAVSLQERKDSGISALTGQSAAAKSKYGKSKALKKISASLIAVLFIAALLLNTALF